MKRKGKTHIIQFRFGDRASLYCGLRMMDLVKNDDTSEFAKMKPSDIPPEDICRRCRRAEAKQKAKKAMEDAKA